MKEMQLSQCPPCCVNGYSIILYYGTSEERIFTIDHKITFPYHKGNKRRINEIFGQDPEDSSFKSFC